MIADCRLNSSMLVETRRATTRRRTVKNRKTENELRTLPVAISTRPIWLPLDQYSKDHGESANCGSYSQKLWHEIHAQFGHAALDQGQQHQQQGRLRAVKNYCHAHACHR